MNTPQHTIAFTAGADTPAYRIVQLIATEGEAQAAAAADDAIIGVSAGVDTDQGYALDAVVVGTADVEYGGAVTRGDWLTADGDGKAVTASPAAGANVNVVGMALRDGVAGDIGSVLLAPGSLQGA